MDIFINFCYFNFLLNLPHMMHVYTYHACPCLDGTLVTVSLLLESYLGVLLDKSQKENKKSTNISMDGFSLTFNSCQ